MSMLGNLSEFSLPDILQMFERAKKSGMLSIWSPIGIYRVWFYQGRIIAAISPERKYSLKELLSSSGVVEASALSEIDENITEPLGNYLRKNDLVAPTDLAKAFRRQLAVGLYSLFTLTSGQFKFSDNTPLPYHEMTGLSKGSMEAAMEGLRQADALATHDSKLPGADSAFMRLTQESPLLQLSALEWKVWERIAPENTIASIAEQAKLELLDVRKVVARLTRVGLIEETQALEAAPVTAKTSANKVSRTAGNGTDKVTAGTAQAQPSKSAPANTTGAVDATLLNRFKSFLKNIR